ncbi:MAG: hypothetical protein RLZZ188_3457, partial [Verrucomicrobiota bacterium]
CKGWRWMPGMRVLGGDRITERTLAIDHGCLPDLRDPATLGCLLALVREAWGDPSLSVLFDHDGCKWCVGRWEDDGLALRCRPADTEAEALVAALEAAP